MKSLEVKVHIVMVHLFFEGRFMKGGCIFIMKKKTKVIVLAMCLLSILSLPGCQENPESDIVVNKNEGNLENAIKKEKRNANNDEYEKDIPESYSDHFLTDIDDIPVVTEAKVEFVENPLPVVRVRPHVITVEEAKLWSDVLFEGKTAYEPEVLTKAEIEERILTLKEKTGNQETLITEGGSEKKAESLKEYYDKLIESYEQEYKSAPENSEKAECRWKFHSYDYYQENASMWEESEEFESLKKTELLKAVTDDLNGHSAIIDVTNRDENDFKMHMLWFYYTDQEEMTDIAYKELSEEKAIELGNQTLQKLELEGWSLWDIQDTSMEEVNSFVLYYTPVFEEVKTILGPDISVKSEDLYAANFYYPKIELHIYNGIIMSVEMTSPLDVVKIENSDVVTIDFDKIYKAFQSQMKTKTNRDTFIDPADPAADEYSLELKVTDITQGLFRIKEKNNEEEFLMVPAWTFSGDVIVNGGNWGKTEFATINALDR